MSGLEPNNNPKFAHSSFQTRSRSRSDLSEDITPGESSPSLVSGERTRKRRSFRPFVIGVSIYIFFLYICFFTLIILPWRYAASTFHFLSFFLFHYGLILLCYNYYKSINTAPGTPPGDWQPPGNSVEQLDEAKKYAVNLASPTSKRPTTRPPQARYCVSCQAFKPPRTHHCSKCDACVLKMDHHCPYIDNCVGHRNQKYFTLFLFYTVVTMMFAFCLYIVRAVEILRRLSDDEEYTYSPVHGLLMVLNMCLILPTVFGIMGLLIYQSILIYRNTTNIESFEREMSQRDAEREGREWKHPYDLGAASNFREVLGSTMLLWLLPSEPAGDGLTYRTNGAPEPVSRIEYGVV